MLSLYRLAVRSFWSNYNDSSAMSCLFVLMKGLPVGWTALESRLGRSAVLDLDLFWMCPVACAIGGRYRGSIVGSTFGFYFDDPLLLSRRSSSRSLLFRGASRVAKGGISAVV